MSSAKNRIVDPRVRGDKKLSDFDAEWKEILKGPKAKEYFIKFAK